MPRVIGANNGASGYGMARGAMFPDGLGMNGPFGYQGYPLPNMYQKATQSFGRRSRTSRKNRMSRKCKSSKKCHRCKATTKDGKRCSHKTKTKYCGHHK